MPEYELKNIPESEVVPGFHARFVHTDSVTIAHWRIEAGATLPEHSHPHEQISNMVSGELELTVEGTPHKLKPGKVLVIPGGALHSGRAVTDCQIIEVFHPVREDYRKKY